MDALYLKNTVEAALLAAGRPLDIAAVRELFDEFERPEVDEVREAFAALAADYEGRAVEIVEVASGFRVQVRSSFAGPVSRLWQERPTKYSRALLETLALIAYRQPITRGEIEDVRGVAVNPNIVKTLTERGWVRVVGTREVPGRPELLGTTREFLDYFGLRSLDTLPSLAELKDMDNVGVQLEFLERPTVAAAPVAGAAPEAQVVDTPVLTVLEGGLAAVADVDSDADADADADADEEDDPSVTGGAAGAGG
ncbi:MAG: SMC-Scp complex subunit ScpB [Steroidobacteraceae bacterium]